jgi:hypothetical protein
MTSATGKSYAAETTSARFVLLFISYFIFCIRLNRGNIIVTMAKRIAIIGAGTYLVSIPHTCSLHVL